MAKATTPTPANAKERRKVRGKRRRAVSDIATVSAENQIRFEVVASVMSTLLGGACAPTSDDCLFPNLMLEAGAG